MKLSTTVCDICCKERESPSCFGKLHLQFSLMSLYDIEGNEVCNVCRSAIREVAMSVYNERRRTAKIVIDAEKGRP